MSKTVGTVKTDVLHRMREYSYDGVEQSDNDISVSIVPLINIHQATIARDTKCIERKHEISHNKPDNLLGTYSWNEQEIHKDSDISYSSDSAKAYSLQIADYATVYIEEYNGSSWDILYTITKTLVQLTVDDGVSPVNTTLDGSEGFITVKGKTNLSDDSYEIRIRFSGDYRYPYRWVALFLDNFYNDDAVPKFEPFVPYDLPTNAFAMKRVTWTHAYEQKHDYNAYRIEKYNKMLRKIYINWYEIGEFVIHYYAMPTVIAVPEFGSLDSSDSVELDIPDEVVPAMEELIIADLTRKDNAYMSSTFKSMAGDSIVHINDGQDSNSENKKVIDDYGWS